MDSEHRAYVRGLPVIRMHPHEFDKLRTYSCSLPTGTTPGKMWRRLDGDHDLDFKRRGGVPLWMVGQYDPDCPADAKDIKILWFRPIIKLTAAFPKVKTCSHMLIPQGAKLMRDTDKNYMLGFQAFTREVREWLTERKICPRRIGTREIVFYRQNDALDFRMRWS
ncbi:MAG: hypothetical protein EOO77_16945 [Oxalobacteraceae bacterium]|nr:MAG: hypothetical protein EOO77_16945 [Oxalobacteraceae bacterium]